MDIKIMKKYLSTKENDVINILKYFKYHTFVKKGNSITCKKENGDGTSVSVKLDENLTSSSFSVGYSGDLIGMIVHGSGLSMGEVLHTIKLIIDNDIGEIDESVKLFDGFLENIYIEDEIEYHTYNEDILTKYGLHWNTRFTDDHIPPKIQRMFELGYDENDNRITIPWRDRYGCLVGVMSRANYETEHRYFPTHVFNKSKFLYGFNLSKECICDTGTVYIGESEKFTMQLFNYGYRNAVSIGSSNISKIQIHQLLEIGCKNFVFCFDEGTSTQIISNNVTKLKDQLFMRDDCSIGVMRDGKNEYMIENSKYSPSDLGLNVWEKLVENNILFRKIA